MAKKPKKVVCTECNLGQEQVTQQTFLGFHRFVCAECKARVTYPLSTSYVAIYGVAIFSLLLLFTDAKVGTCGILGIAGILALAIDFGIRRRVREAEAHERTLGQVRADVFE